MNKHIVILLFVILAATSCKPRCNDIIDIYYSDLERYDAYHIHCSYTKTPKGCRDCGSVMFKRSDVATLKEFYRNKGLKMPSYMKVIKNRDVFSPVGDGYLN